ncbi:MAG: hypothetical protein ACRENO_09670, partial [Thermodesulfobacteriota bacterium]
GYLKAKTYGPDNLNNGLNLDLDDEALIKRLRSFGITHIVAGSEDFIERIKEFAIEEPVKINSHTIIKISETPLEKVEKSKKELIGFVDFKGNTPFTLLDLYFYVTDYFENNFELIQLDDIQNIPAQINTIIVNGEEKKILKLKEKIKEINIVNLDYEDRSFKVNHYRPIRRSINPELYQYRYLASYLENEFDLRAKFEIFFKDKQLEEQENISNQKFKWSNDFQSFSLSNLIPGEVYRINYSYFPYWHSKDGQLFRGSGDRIFFIPNKSNAFIKYTRIYSASTWLGWFSTIISIISICWFYRKNAKIKQV